MYWLHIPFYKQTPLEIFQMLLGDTQRVKLFICSKLFICVFEILNPGGPLISMIIFFLGYFIRGIKGFQLIPNKHLYFFHFNTSCCDPSVSKPATSGSLELLGII